MVKDIRILFIEISSHDSLVGTCALISDNKTQKIGLCMICLKKAISFIFFLIK